MREPESPEVCPVCGEDVPRAALACPECGADHNSGWRPDAEIYDGVDLPEEFDPSPKPIGIKIIWGVTAILLIALTLLYFSR